MKKVALTGATGFIGRHTVEELLKRGFEIYSLSLSPDPAVENICFKNEVIDLFDYEAVADFFSRIKPEYLLHLAWDTTPGSYWTSEENFRWLQASIELVVNFHKNGGRRVVAAGSCAEYDWNHNFLSEFSTPKNPTTPYGVCKNALFQLLESYSNLKGLSFSWARLFFIFGPHEKQERLIPYFISSLLKKKGAVCDNPDAARDFLYVKDAAAAFGELLESKASGPFNIASGAAYKIKDVVDFIAEITGGKEFVEYGGAPSASGQPLVLIGDNLRLIGETGWQVKTGLKEALVLSVQWWKDELVKRGELK